MAPSLLSCSSNSTQALDLPGINVLNIAAAPVTSYPIPTVEVPGHGFFPPGTIDFCNVTVTYTHPGQDNQLNVEVWLPAKDDWNERALAVGGGGLVAGRGAESYAPMAGVVSEGFATFSTDGGLTNPNEPAEWVLNEAGELDETVLENWGTVSLSDMALIGKDVVKRFYGKPADYSYFIGCSQGGRQGYALAQLYPDSFDGIAANAPAIRLPEILMGWYWPQLLMNLDGEYPRGCEMDSLTSLALARCDGKDGIEDGIISDPYACDSFNPYDEVGSPAVDCADPSTGISEAAAYIVNATWAGIWDEEGVPQFFAQLPGTDLVGVKSGIGVASTTCYDEEQDCAGAPLPLGPWWISIFALKEPEFDVKNLTLAQFYDVLRDTREEYAQYVGTNDPDLSSFKEAGGKLITYHGLADQTIPSGISRDYYERASAIDADVSGYFRLFEVPSLGHCIGNGHPVTVLDALIEWVEKDTVPDTLPVTLLDSAGESNERIVCAYPQVAVFSEECGDSSITECFTCQ